MEHGERGLRRTSVCAHEREGEPAWMQLFGLMARLASSLLPPCLSPLSRVSQLFPMTLCLLSLSLCLWVSLAASAVGEGACVGTEGSSWGWGHHGSG